MANLSAQYGIVSSLLLLALWPPRTPCLEMGMGIPWGMPAATSAKYQNPGCEAPAKLWWRVDGPRQPPASIAPYGPCGARLAATARSHLNRSLYRRPWPSRSPTRLDLALRIADDTAVWLFVGTGKKFEVVPNGREVVRDCEKCERTTTFYERKVTRRVSLYFVDLFAHSPKYIMACGACGAGFAVDHLQEHGFMENQTGTALGFLGGIADKARSAIDEGNLPEEASRLGESVGEAANRAKDSVDKWVSSRLRKK